MKDRFSRPFYLSHNKLATVAYMFLLGWGEVMLGNGEGDIVRLGGRIGEGMLCSFTTNCFAN